MTDSGLILGQLFVPLGFFKNSMTLYLGFIIIEFSFRLGFIKRTPIFISVLSKMSVFFCLSQRKYLLLQQYNNKNKNVCT